MRKSAILLLIVGFAACTKEETVRTSGIDTIDNITYYTSTYINYGFLFSGAKLMPTYPPPGTEITIYVIKDILPYRLTLQSSNMKPSFFRVGDYDDETTAQSAFDDLLTITDPQWEDMADPVEPNQIWVFRTGGEKYVKIRIISTVNEKRDDIDYGECTFEWVYQPDGSPTFPE